MALSKDFSGAYPALSPVSSNPATYMVHLEGYIDFDKFSTDVIDENKFKRPFRGKTKIKRYDHSWDQEIEEEVFVDGPYSIKEIFPRNINDQTVASDKIIGAIEKTNVDLPREEDGLPKSKTEFHFTFNTKFFMWNKVKTSLKIADEKSVLVAKDDKERDEILDQIKMVCGLR